MARARWSATVAAPLLEAARRLRSEFGDGALAGEALAAVPARQRAAQIGAGCAAYERHPRREPDAWGDLASLPASRCAVVTALAVAVDCRM
jgi:hypothetical protein